jgi:hypothetical protein
MKAHLFKILLSASILSGAAWLLLAMDNDGKPDVVWRNHASGGANSVWTLNEGVHTATIALASLTDLDWKFVATADFNSDGQLDILLYHPTSGHIGIWYMNGTTLLSSTNLYPTLYMTEPATWDLIGAGYFGGNGDKRPDLLWLNKNTAELCVWHMNGESFLSAAYLKFTNGVNVAIPSPWTFASTADYNNDGHTDLILRDQAYGQNGAWIFNGTTYESAALLTATSDLNWDIVGANYFDSGNFSVDLFWRHKTTGLNAIWFMDGPNVTSFVVLPSRELTWKVAGTGDSKLDNDADSLPDLWERNHFGHLQEGPYGDYDGDGASNLEEYLNGTNPASDLGLHVFTPLK